MLAITVAKHTRFWNTNDYSTWPRYKLIEHTAVLEGIKQLGVTHIWYTGVPHHALVAYYSRYGIIANGSRLTLVLNGITTVDIEHSKLDNGFIALQWGSGTIKFRKLEIRTL